MVGARWKRRLMYGVAALAVAGGALAAWAQLASRHKMQRLVHVDAKPVAYAQDAGAAANGRYLYTSRGCVSCHGADGAGSVFVNEPNGLYLRGANITTGAGSAVANYKEQDWVRAIRHGIKPDGRPVLIMPSEDYNRLTDGDLASLVAFIRGFAPADSEGAVIQLPLLVKALYAAGYVRDAAEKIDHALPVSTPVPAAPTVEHGRYVANTCIGCHGPGLSGGRIPGTPPDWPPAANLTSAPSQAMARYASVAQFKTLIRSGTRPDGTPASKHMPRFPLNDTDLEALHAYLKALPPRATGSR